MRPLNEDILPETSANSLTTTEIIKADFLVASSVQVILTGTGSGVFKIQASNDLGVFHTGASQVVPTNFTDISQSVTVTGNGTFIIPKFDMCYNFIRGVYTSSFAGVQTIVFVGDTSGSLKSTYFLLGDAADAHKYYVWFDNGSGVDPAVSGRTGVKITYTDDDTATTLAGLAETAIAALNSTNSFTASAVTGTLTVTNKVGGWFTPMTDGAAATGFTFAVTGPTGIVKANLHSFGI